MNAFFSTTRATAGTKPITGALHLEREQIAHDARNLLCATDLYYELLSAPGVLAPHFSHYANDLRSLGGSGARLLTRVAESMAETAKSDFSISPSRSTGIEDLAGKLQEAESCLRALAGPNVDLEFDCSNCPGRIALTAEMLLRLLSNLILNAVRAMERSPRLRARVRISVRNGVARGFHTRPSVPMIRSIILSVRDNGVGITRTAMSRKSDHLHCRIPTSPRIRETKSWEDEQHLNSSIRHGLGSGIVRRLTEAAGGRMTRVSSPGVGTRIDLELPIVSECSDESERPTDWADPFGHFLDQS